MFNYDECLVVRIKIQESRTPFFLKTSGKFQMKRSVFFVDVKYLLLQKIYYIRVYVCIKNGLFLLRLRVEDIAFSKDINRNMKNISSGYY